MIRRQIICLKRSVSKSSFRSDLRDRTCSFLSEFIATDFQDFGAMIFSESEQRFLQKNIISDMMFFKNCNVDF